MHLRGEGPGLRVWGWGFGFRVLGGIGFRIWGEFQGLRIRATPREGFVHGPEEFRDERGLIIMGVESVDSVDSKGRLEVKVG